MVQSVELIVDDVTEAAIRAEWAALELAGIANAGRHTGASNRPHLTVAVAQRIPDETGVAAAAAAVALPVRIHLGGLLLFAHRGRYVLSRGVVADEPLLDLHRRLWTATGRDQPVTTHPGRWTPHLTIARRLSASEVGAALGALEGVGVADGYAGTAVGIRRWDGDARREWPLT